MFPVLVIQKKFASVIQDIVANIKQGHQDVHNVIHIARVHVIRPNAVAMDIMQVVNSVIVTTAVVVILNVVMIVQQIMVNVL